MASTTPRSRSTLLKVKRALDVTLSAIALLLLALPAIVIYIAVRADSPGPALFRQDRLGKNGTTFSIYKFRTMEHGAENRGMGIYTSRLDPRITRVGRFLRKTSLDEVPQLLNVLRGDMSLVGPRPPLPSHPSPFGDYGADERRRFDMAPGLTGLAQVQGRNTLSRPERIRYDVEYVDNWSLRLDFEILIRTVAAAVRGSGVFSDKPERR